MQKVFFASRLILHTILFLTLPTTAGYPQAEFKVVSVQEEASVLPTPSFDDILNLLEDLEEGELEERCGPEDLERINHFLANLAQQGAIPGEFEEDSELQNDIQELLEGKPNLFAYSMLREGEYIALPAVYYGDAEAILCKSWIKKQWKQTKKFVKKHKKTIIIGAAVVVAAAIVVGVVVATSTAGAAAAGAAASRSGKKDQSEADEVAADDPPILHSVMEEHITDFKEAVMEEGQIQASSQSGLEDAMFEEQVRHFGSALAHQTLEGIVELTPPPKLEVLLGASSLLIPNDLITSKELEKDLENIVAAGHEKIDQAFDTEQAGYYTPEAKKRREDKFVVGVLPPPTSVGRVLTAKNSKK